jgi:hypothetical protein
MAAVLASISRAVAAEMTSTVVDVPTFVFGEPRFSVDDVTEHVRMNLEGHGYNVDTFPGVPSVAISWGDARSRTGDVRDREMYEKPSIAASGQYDVGL